MTDQSPRGRWMRRFQLTAADALAAGIGGLVGMVVALGVCESMLRKAARR